MLATTHSCPFVLELRVEPILLLCLPVLRLTMQRLHGTRCSAITACGVYLCGRRHIRKDLSPDRTYSEQIQDSQNRFAWHSKHMFRPHQHFTYDPSSWSRPLEEQSKQREKAPLAVITRLRMEREREAERAEHVPVAEHGSPGNPQHHGDGAKHDDRHEDDVFSSTGATAASSPSGLSGVSLQELLEATSAAQAQLTSPRFRKNESLVLADRLRGQLRELLRHVFARLEKAVIDETVSLDALVFTWFTIFASREDLLLAVSDSDASTPVDTEEGMSRIETVLRRTLLAEAVVARLPSLCAEGAVEALYLLTHPSIRFLLVGGADGERSQPLVVPPLYEETVSRLVTKVGIALSEAPLAPESPEHSPRDDGEPEMSLDPLHVAALAESLHRLSNAQGAVSTVECRTALGHCQTALVRVMGQAARTVTALLRSAVPSSPKQQIQRALTRTPTSTAAPHDGVARNRRAIDVDPSDAPRGIQAPPTDPMDITYVVRAYAAAFATARDTHSARDAEMADTVLRLVSYAPNYDLPASTSLEVCQYLLRCLTVAQRTRLCTSTEEERWLRLALFLSRIDPARCARHKAVYKLFMELCLTPEPPFSNECARHEWRRLRGVALQRLLGVCSVSFLQGMEAAETAAPGEWPAWEVAAAFGAASVTGSLVVTPALLWRQACVGRLGTTDGLHSAALSSAHRQDGVPRVRCSPDVAAALVVLCGRLSDPRRGHRRFTVDDVSALYVVACMEALTSGRVELAALLHGDVSAWQEARTQLIESFAPPCDHDSTCALLAEVMEVVQERDKPSANVMSFD